MEVSMDTSPAQSTQSQPQTLSPALGTPRKRSLNEIEMEGRSGSAAENQENSDPSGGGQDGGKDNVENAGASAAAGTMETAVRVEIPLGSIPPPNANTEQQGDAHTNTTGDVKGDAGTPASKKRKLSPASKEAKQQEKEAKDRQRTEEKAKKEEDKAKREEERKVKEEEKKKREADREEEKRKREAEREEKKRAKDEERAAREEERRKKEEEKSKKEKAQMRLNAFFAKPKTPGESTSTGPGGSPKKNVNDATANDDADDVVSDYYRVFPEFFLQSHTMVAPPHRFEPDSEALAVMRQRVDESLKSASSGSSEPPVFRPSEVFRMIPYKRRWGRQAASVKDILLQIQSMGGNGEAAVGTGRVDDAKLSRRRPQDLLNNVRMKSLKFGEDVRPPYQGTFTRKVPESSAQKLSRNPFRRCLPDTNYDYDSEAEWEEPEEGEELDSEEEEEADEEVDDDMEGFLDDDGDEDQPADGKRRLIVGDLEPQTSGIRWQEASNAVDPVLQMYKVETIFDAVTFPIDPFSTAYWQKPRPADAGPAGNGALSDRSTTLLSGSRNATADRPPTLLGAGKAKRGFPPEQLAEFKEVVDGSDLTKMGLVEILKKRFPKVSKDVLKETLTSQATRMGNKESEKKWVCK